MDAYKTCLLIDDDSDDQEIFLAALADISCTMHCSAISDAEDALTLLKKSSDLPDVVFLDINMPRMDGFEFLVHLKRDDRLRNIPVIFYSTTVDTDQISKAKKLGASGFISKANSYDSLCEVLRKVFVTANEGLNAGLNAS